MWNSYNSISGNPEPGKTKKKPEKRMKKSRSTKYKQEEKNMETTFISIWDYLTVVSPIFSD